MVRVSVCIATYNGERFIREQLESILIQLGIEDEIIVSDDGSTDRTLDILKSYDDKRVKIIRNNGYKGVAHNFENALSHANGEYIFLCDQDDIWADNKVEVILENLKIADCVLHNAELIDSFGKSLNNNLFSIYRTRKGYVNNLIRNTFVGCCMALKKDLLKYILPIPKNITMHDMWIALIAEKKGKTCLNHDKLMYYRRHDNNVSTTSQKSSFSRYFQIKYRLQMLYYTLVR